MAADTAVVGELLRAQLPALAGLPLVVLSNTGSDNTLYRLGDAYVVRLPRAADAARRLDAELDWLPRLTNLPVSVPELVHVGTPDSAYPFRWAVLRWLDGTDAWAARDRDGWFSASLGHDLADVVRQFGRMDVLGAPTREPGERGGPLLALDDRVRWWLDQADGLVDGRVVLGRWEQCLEAAEVVVPVLLHGDLIPGNLLVAGGRLTAVLDWGGIGSGDPAQDLDPAWSVLDPAGAKAFRESLAVDDATWLRGCGFALEHAIGGVVHYVPRRHPLGDVMQRTLDRLLRPDAIV